MKRFLLIMAAWLLPVSADAQMRLDFDADAYYEPPAAAAPAATPDRAAATETAADKARSVRHGEKTVRLATGAVAGTGEKPVLTAVVSPY